MTFDVTGERRGRRAVARELEVVRRFPEENPNPVLQVSDDGRLLYANPASAPIVEALGVDAGDALPADFATRVRAAMGGPRPRPFELDAGERTFSLVAVECAELGFVNLYGTDVTAARVLARFPDWNPNPVMRISRGGKLLYANVASAAMVRGVGVEVGADLPADLVARLRRSLDDPGVPPPEVRSESRVYSLVPVLVPELGSINVYGTDVTALKAIDKFPDENPNPVLRVTRDGALQYANPASRPVAAALGIAVGEPLPRELFERIQDVLAGPEQRLEVRADGRTYEFLVKSVYEFDFINLYGTDVTAARAIEQMNRENERLLLAILPPSVADRLRRGETAIADSFDDMAVLFADLVGFTELSARLTPAGVVQVLNAVFWAFDELADLHGLEKIKTIGDAYMAVGGLDPEEGAPDPAAAVADMALGMVSAIERLAAESGHPLRVRVGIHTGPTVAGVIGMRKFIYDVWGHAVNTASRMESTGLPGRVQVSRVTYERLRHAYAFEPRGTVEVKGLGSVETFFLLGPRS